MLFNILFFPFTVIFVSIRIVLAVLITIFWVWMIADCIKRKFKNDTEKIIWVFAIILLSWLGALIYYFSIRISNPRGFLKILRKNLRESKYKYFFSLYTLW